MSATLKIRFVLEDEPGVAMVTVRYGNHWRRARIRTTADNLMQIATCGDGERLVELMECAKESGEFWSKDGAGKPWVKEDAKKEGGAE